MRHKIDYADQKGYYRSLLSALKYWRKERGYTQEIMGNLISDNTTKQYISSLERGASSSMPSLAMVLRYAEALDIPPALLFDSALPEKRADQLSTAIKLFRKGCTVDMVKVATPLLSVQELQALYNECSPDEKHKS